MAKKEIILAVGSVSFIVLVVCLALLLADKFDVDKSVCGCPKVISHNFVWIFIILAIIFVSCLLYYLFSLKMETQDKIINKNKEILFTILDEDEKSVLNHLVKNKGEVQQSKISEMFDKIRAHRIIKKLSEKKIIDSVKDGKTNKIILKKELRKELL